MKQGSLLTYKKLASNNGLTCYGYSNGGMLKKDYGYEIKDENGNVVTKVESFKEAMEILRRRIKEN